MSTKIFDAWRINSTDIGELVKLGNEIREVQKKSFVDAVYNSLDFCQLAIIFAKKSWWTSRNSDLHLHQSPRTSFTSAF